MHIYFLIIYKEKNALILNRYVLCIHFSLYFLGKIFIFWVKKIVRNFFEEKIILVQNVAKNNYLEIIKLIVAISFNEKC